MLRVLGQARTFKTMIKKSQEYLKKFFSFSDCGVLFFNKNRNQLFTIETKIGQDENKEEDEDEEESTMLDKDEIEDL